MAAYAQDYLKSVVPSQLISERGSNLVVINPGSANVRVGFAHQQVPFSVRHCIARYFKPRDDGSKHSFLQDEMLNCKASATQNLERERAYDIIASLLKIPFLDEEAPSSSLPPKMGRVDSFAPQQGRSDSAFTWTNVKEKVPKSHQADESTSTALPNSEEYKYREIIFGEDALKICPSEPYCLRRPIRRGHFNISQNYSFQQVCEDLIAIWNWILTEKLNIHLKDRSSYSAILVLPETFDNREIKEMLSIVLRDLRFSTAVVHQEGLAAAFGNGLSTACVVNIGAQVTSVICVEDGVAIPATTLTLPFGGEDISRCFLWAQRRRQTWPNIPTDPLHKPVDLLMLNKLRETYCQIREGGYDGIAVVHSYEQDKPVSTHKTKLSSLNVPPMGLFYPKIFAHEEYSPPPRSWFNDSEDMLEDTWNMEYAGGNVGLGIWDSYYPVYPTRLKKYDNVGLAEAIVSSILSTGRIDLQRKLFCSIQLIGGVASTIGLVPAVEDRVLHAIPSNEAIDTVEVLQSRSEPSYVSWKGGAIIGILDFGREAWIHREDWIKNGIHIGSGRKYKDSYFLQSQAMCYYNA
ncbi:hypothetical protein LUZ61_010008 [Rhynchospora tenuis]|uniref:Actin-related protein 9 n=1 Tax=Rhynchospora tenuis TaxID=198213 RepID=A0AAD6EZ80_9POAL|nr:hypothetical protein LUZ61_010008 [Rhynchospora tenuis]